MKFSKWIKQDWIYISRKKHVDGKVEFDFSMHPLFMLVVIIIIGLAIWKTI